MKLVLATALIALAATATAEETRRNVNPLAIQGRWLGTPGALPPECTVDGYIVLFGTSDGKKFQMGVQPRTGGVAPLNPKNTIYNVIEPPPGAPVRLEIFLEAEAEGQKLVMGIDQTGGSTLEIAPAGADGAFAATTLYLRRCS